jgi:hypothetical protein
MWDNIKNSKESEEGQFIELYYEGACEGGNKHKELMKCIKWLKQIKRLSASQGRLPNSASLWLFLYNIGFQQTPSVLTCKPITMSIINRDSLLLSIITLWYKVALLLYLLTAIGLSPGGSTHLHTNTTQNNTNNNQTTLRAVRAPSLRVLFSLAFALQLRKKQGKTSARVRKTSIRLRYYHHSENNDIKTHYQFKEIDMLRNNWGSLSGSHFKRSQLHFCITAMLT